MDDAMQSARKLATAHNSSVWPLYADLTIKVFSMLDTKSVCFAATTCSLFRKCASDPLCYANIDLTRSVAKVSYQAISTMIRKAGKSLQSIKLGRLPHDKKTSDKALLTGSGLSALALDGGASGMLLQELHLYNLDMQVYNLCSVLSACQSLVKLEIVGVKIWLDIILRTISKHCHSIEYLCLDIRASGSSDALNMQAWKLNKLKRECPLLSTLALRGYQIEDDLLSLLIKGPCNMTSFDLSGSYGFSGIFLKDHGRGGAADSLETLILRDCRDLRAEEVSGFMLDVLHGDWKGLRYVDISNSQGLLHGLNRTHPRCAIDVSKILQERPDVRLIADFPPEMHLSPLT